MANPERPDWRPFKGPQWLRVAILVHDMWERGKKGRPYPASLEKSIKDRRQNSPMHWELMVTRAIPVRSHIYHIGFRTRKRPKVENESRDETMVEGQVIQIEVL